MFRLIEPPVAVACAVIVKGSAEPKVVFVHVPEQFRPLSAATKGGTGRVVGACVAGATDATLLAAAAPLAAADAAAFVGGTAVAEIESSPPQAPPSISLPD